ncbi:MAG: GNAT family N-acetyltransferase [Methanomicrobiales archaeon]|nr:GNAT family N-acetyltransferase [Methanomicrobiales archaeon]
MKRIRESLPFLTGPRLYLRPLELADCEGPYLDWFNDEEVCRGNRHHTFPYTPEKAREYVGMTRSSTDELVLAIVDRKEETHIGNIALQQIHSIYRSAEFSIIIGDKGSWGKGYGTEAGRLLLDHGFFRLNLHRVACGTFETNTPMQHLALALGMREEGRRRQAAFVGGQYVDVIEYGVLRDEYERFRAGMKE